MNRCNNLFVFLKHTPEAFSSGHTKIVDFAHFYWFGQFLLISGCTRLNLLISTAYGRGRPPCAPSNQDFCHGRHQNYWFQVDFYWFGAKILIWNQQFLPPMGSHIRGHLKSKDLAPGRLKSIKIAQINKNEQNQQFWRDQMKKALVNILIASRISMHCWRAIRTWTNSSANGGVWGRTADRQHNPEKER